MSEWKWYASSNEEEYTIGPCDTRDQIIEEAVGNELGYDDDEKTQHRMVFHIVEAKHKEGDLSAYFSAEDWLERLADTALESEYAEDRDPLKGIDTIGLEVAVREAIKSWQAQSGFKMELWEFAACRNGEWIEQTFPWEEPTHD